MKYSDYSNFFELEEDGTFSIREDFLSHIKELKGSSLSNVINFALGEIEDGKLGGAFITKDERYCSYNYIPEKLRWDVYERDNFTCKNCGTRRYLSIDHIYPKSKGGKTTLENCQTLCRQCNSKKGAR